MNAPQFLLCIETSSPVCSVALGKDGELSAEKISGEPNGHSRVLAQLIHDTVYENGITFNELSAVAVNAGPGSYTGLRIGMSSAKGLCYALGIPLIAIRAFDSMVHTFLSHHTPGADDLILPMIDARRMEVYTQVFDAGGNPLADQQAYISGEDGLLPDAVPGKLWLIGSGAEKMAPGFPGYDVEAFPDAFLSAAGLLPLANRRFAEKQFDDVAYTTPNYGKAWQKA